MFQTKTIRWQCSGCDRLCALLTDELVQPQKIIRCPYAKAKWRIVEKNNGGKVDR